MIYKDLSKVVDLKATPLHVLTHSMSWAPASSLPALTRGLNARLAFYANDYEMHGAAIDFKFSFKLKLISRCCFEKVECGSEIG